MMMVRREVTGRSGPVGMMRESFGVRPPDLEAEGQGRAMEKALDRQRVGVGITRNRV